MKLFCIYPLLCLLLLSTTIHAAEEDLLKAYPQIFQRKADILTIKLNDGKNQQIFIDKKDDKCVSYEACGTTIIKSYYDLQKIVLLYHVYYEGDSYSLLSLDSGKELFIPSEPIWSKNHHFFISTNESFTGSSENVFIIGRCDDNKCENIFEKEVPAFAPRWQNANKLTVRVVTKYNAVYDEIQKSKLVTCIVSDEGVNCQNL
jgi:hypothetical protein